MALVKIRQVQLANLNSERLRGFALDTPAPETTRDVYDIEFAGWAVGQDTPVGAVEFHVEGTVLRRVSLDQQRLDVARDYPGIGGVESAGFRTWISTVGLEPGVPIQLRAVMKDETRLRLGSVHFSHQPLRPNFSPTLQPLMLTTLGRAGTTWTMRLLSEHPKIVVHRQHPYELRTARYWMHAFKVMTEPRDPYRSAQADIFQNDKSWAGHNPFYPVPVAETPGMERWFGCTHVEQVAAFTMQTVDACYQQIAAGQGQTGAVYFAEKHRADALPWLYWELYPKAKEIFLVRDFRDVFSSMLAFNKKQGRRVFGHDRLADDAEFAQFVRNGPIRLLSKSWPKRQDRAHLVRYEDLLQNPAATLKGMLAYLELDAGEATLDGILARGTEENADMKRHLTSSEVTTSIGRWRNSLDPGLQQVCNDVFGDVLTQFGYTV